MPRRIGQFKLRCWPLLLQSPFESTLMRLSWNRLSQGELHAVRKADTRTAPFTGICRTRFEKGACAMHARSLKLMVFREPIIAGDSGLQQQLKPFCSCPGS